MIITLPCVSSMTLTEESYTSKHEYKLFLLKHNLDTKVEHFNNCDAKVQESVMCDE